MKSLQRDEVYVVSHAERAKCLNSTATYPRAVLTLLQADETLPGLPGFNTVRSAHTLEEPTAELDTEILAIMLPTYAVNGAAALCISECQPSFRSTTRRSVSARQLMS